MFDSLTIRQKFMEVRYSILEYDDPTLYDAAYYQILCNGFHIGTAKTEKEAERKIEEYKKNLKESG